MRGALFQNIMLFMGHHSLKLHTDPLRGIFTGRYIEILTSRPTKQLIIKRYYA